MFYLSNGLLYVHPIIVHPPFHIATSFFFKCFYSTARMGGIKTLPQLLLLPVRCFIFHHLYLGLVSSRHCAHPDQKSRGLLMSEIVLGKFFSMVHWYSE